MLLAADIGNTNTAIGLYDGERLVAHWRLTTAPERTDDELEIWLRNLLELKGLRGDDVSGVAISSVVPAMTTAFSGVAAEITSGEVVVVGAGIKTGMIISIDNPREVGADRVVNAVASRERYGPPCIVVDFGTSTNFDVVGPEGDYLGGSIAPGLVISTNALISGTAALRRVEFTPPRSAIGKGTVEAIQSGALYGHAGLVDGIMERIAADVGGDVTRIATGGLASTVVPHCSSVSTIDEYLTLDGLRMIYDMNRERVSAHDSADGSPEEALDDRIELADHPLTAHRLAKHQATLDGSGYPYRFERSHLAGLLHDTYGDLEPGAETGQTVTVAGRIRNIRAMGKLTFAVVSDVSGTIQLFVDKRVLGEDGFAAFADLDMGDWVGATGEVIATRKGELSVRIGSFELLAKALRPLPDKFHGLTDIEARSRQRYVDLMVNQEARDVALARAKTVSLFRREFEARGYIEVETPVLLNQATGAMARPFATHHNALGLDMYLRIATELYLKRLVVGGLERVFEVGKIFRNEGIDATHMPEFTMLESYEALADYEDIACMVEEMFATIASEVAGSAVLSYQGRSLDLTPPYRRMPMLALVNEAIEGTMSFDLSLDQAIGLARGNGLEPEAHWGHGKIIEELFDRHVQGSIWEPVFVTQHPVEVSPLARRHPDDPNVTERWELFIAGSEYGNAFSELNEPLDQRRRFELQMAAKAAGDDEAQEIDEDYVRALEYGMPPTGGLGIGIDRLVMLLTDKPHIREVILFPTMRPES